MTYQGDVGPLAAGLPVEVPLWMAIMLKQRLKCRIIPPNWMDVGRCFNTSWISVLTIKFSQLFCFKLYSFNNYNVNH